MEQDTGGRAFPWCGDLNECPTVNLGMTLRDYFAAKAMQAIVGAAYLPDSELAVRSELQLAEQAYEFADAMIKARSHQ